MNKWQTLVEHEETERKMSLESQKGESSPVLVGKKKKWQKV